MNTCLHVLLCGTYVFVERVHIWIEHYVRMWNADATVGVDVAWILCT